MAWQMHFNIPDHIQFCLIQFEIQIFYAYQWDWMDESALHIVALSMHNKPDQSNRMIALPESTLQTFNTIVVWQASCLDALNDIF